MKINKEIAKLYSSLNLMNRINMKGKESISLFTILWQHKDVLISRMRRIEKLTMSNKPLSF